MEGIRFKCFTHRRNLLRTRINCSHHETQRVDGGRRAGVSSESPGFYNLFWCNDLSAGSTLAASSFSFFLSGRTFAKG